VASESSEKLRNITGIEERGKNNTNYNRLTGASSAHCCEATESINNKNMI